MKIRLFSLAAVLGLICVLFCGCDSSRDYQAVGADEKQVVYTSLEEMEEASSVILECVRLDGDQPVIGRNGDRIMNAYTLSKVQVTRIHKDSSDSLQEGDILCIQEYEAAADNGRTIYYSCDYRMMVEGKTYLLFLRKQSSQNDTYIASGITGGTVSLEEDGRIFTEDGGPDAGKSLYESIWQEAIEKYVN